ncbi:MAG: 5-formyltetrahydrofolate cyclo-ligase [Flavobacteriia bacterium]|nr:5-formyltetrahydrofolate cyclo-ligase [Flavobacteriia bacterium]OJX36197.1 MAG: 5-formyltetrahydrofolate cyclo-ligase [Flavobacteriia bacterium 40-80]
MRKDELRKIFLEKRAQLSDLETFELTREISGQVFENFSFANKTVSLFLSITNKKEVNTSLILRELLDDNCRIAIPRSDFSTSEIEHFLYEGEEQLEINKYGIPEPQYGTTVRPEEFDIVFVPLLCFDEKGYRVGYGKGFYDRFLSQCKKECMIIGLSFFEAVEEIEGIHENDVPLQYCVTPHHLYHFDGE